MTAGHSFGRAKSINDFGGDWQSWEQYLYDLYEADFLNSKPIWPIGGKPLAIKSNPRVEGRCGTFWHLIAEEDENLGQRVIHTARCEYLPWARQVLNAFAQTHPEASSNEICWWIEVVRGRDRYHLSTTDFSYLVVVEDRPNYVLLVTAFPIEREHQRGKKRAKFEAYWAERAKAALSDGLETPSTAGR